MKDLSTVNHFHYSEKLVNVLMRKTQNKNPLFFRVLVAYYFAKVASMMRAYIETKDRGDIPVNMYAINLAASGYGKGHSVNIIEEQVITQFKNEFLNTLFPIKAEENLIKVANIRARKYNEDPDIMLERVTSEFEQLGTLAFSFDSGTSAAIKQMRHKLLLATAGSMNFVMDEVGSNLTSNIDILNTFLELYDIGRIKNKLTKNTKENIRYEEIDGRTPANMILFGTPTKLLNGGKTEDEFYSLLETGFARRCIFGYASKESNLVKPTPEEVYDMLTDNSSDKYLNDLNDYLSKLAAEPFFNKKIIISKNNTLKLIEYRLDCEERAAELSDYEEIQKSELSHRYYKALKLAGTYAFIDMSHEIREDHLYAAIKLCEESGEAFTKILSRERPYVKLAKYIANVKKEITQADLVEDLPFYKGSDSQKKEMMTLAIAYGYKHNIIIKRTYSDGIEFLQGESMEETKLSTIITSYSTDITTGYLNELAPWDKLHKLITMDGYHYTNMHFKDGYRSSDKAFGKFNVVMVDVDGGTNIELVKDLLKEFTYLIATTKRHTDESNRFRVIMPLSHVVKLNPANYKKFMQNLFKWLPFKVDEQASDIARKWQSHNGTYFYNEGEFLDAMLFIPETKKEEEQSKKITDVSSLDNLQRWFLLNTNSGNRNNQILKLALALVDSGYTLTNIQEKIIEFNNKLSNPLDELELQNTVLVTAAKAINQRDQP